METVLSRRAKLIALNPDLPAHAGLAWSEQSDAKIKRLGNPPHLVAAHLNDRALLRHHRDELGPDRDLRLAAAQVDYQQSLRIREQLANDRPTIELAQTYMNLGIVAAAQGRHADAIEKLKRALKLYSEVHGPEHPALWKPHLNLGASLFEHGEGPQARVHLEAARRIASDNLGPRHLKIANIDLTLAFFHLDDDLDRALTLAREAESIYSEQLTERDPRWTETFTTLGQIYMERGEPGLALKYREELLRRSETAEDQVAARYDLAKALHALERTPEALALIAAGLELIPTDEDLLRLRSELQPAP